MKINSVKKYLTSTDKKPFFLFISDLKYRIVLNELSAMGLKVVPMSSFCEYDDKLPDFDRLLTYIDAADINAKGKNLVVTGLGELLALQGCNKATHALSRLKDFNIGGAKVVLLLRGLNTLIGKYKADPRFDNRRFNVVDNADCDLSFILATSTVEFSALSGFKAMLTELENGRCGRVAVKTVINLDNSIFTIHEIKTAYEGIKFLIRNFGLERSCGSEAKWIELLSELNHSNGSLDMVFEKYDFGNNLESNFYNRIAGSEYRSWLYFICLKCSANTMHNGYLRYVLDITSRFEDFVTNVLNSIINISHTDKLFQKFYQERKDLVKEFPESDIANFVVNNRKVMSDSIYKLTDNTMTECEEIIAWVSKNDLVPEIANIYPVLADYLRKYIFKSTESADLLSKYFESYKRQKMSNCIEPAFLDKVQELALSRRFNRLPTRNEILNSMDKKDTFLYWLDALGVEYLGLIEALVQKRGLSVRINIARAELPTITKYNRDFFDAWQGTNKQKNDDLDDVKHKDKGGFNFTSNELPIHIAKELNIIVKMIDKASTELALRHCKRFLIVSDHGASRLAVLRRKEEKYDTDTTGEHSGRCCKLFQPYNLPFATEENGYIVLADYGRFKGSRAANVEVHGGASLEEVVVPVIELSLKDESITVKLVDETVTVDYRNGTEIKLFFNSQLLRNVFVVLKGNSYSAAKIDSNHYSVKIPDIKRAGNYSADVYTSDNLIGKITIKAQGKSGKVNDTFDNLF